MPLQTLPPASRDLARAQARVKEATRRAVVTEWARMGADFDESWSFVGRRLLSVVVLAQRAAAVEGVAYVPTVLAQLDVDAPPAGEVVTSRLSGVASDGRPLDSLLRHAVVVAKDATAAGASLAEALDQGGAFVQRVAALQVVDALRVASGVAVATRPTLTGYVRMLQGASCGRCVVLAGRWFRWSQGFQRHERCDCVHVPAPESLTGDLAVDPRRAFNAMSGAQQSKAFTVNGAQAIRDGADPSQVLNARRGMRTASVGGRKVLATSSGAGRSVRLMPESIYGIAAGNRAEALRLLRVHGYVR